MSAPPPENAGLAQAKAALRAEVRARNDAFEAVRDEVSAAVVSHLVASDLWRGLSLRSDEARPAMAYLAMRSEVDLDGLWRDPGRPAIGVPVVEEVGDEGEAAMTVARVEDPIAGTIPGAFGVRAPRDGAPVIDPASLGVVLVPGMAFDRQGRRLGRGGGFYDRFLAGLCSGIRGGLRGGQPVFVGVAWSGRVVDAVPVGPADVSVHMLLTEHGLERVQG